MTEPAFVRSHRYWIDRRGRAVSVQRVTGYAPTTTTKSVDLKAVVSNYAPDSEAASSTGYGAGKPGGITQGDREVILMEQDLIDGGFPLPVKKDDKLVLNGEKLNVVFVDAEKRALAGAIELKVVGVR